METLPPNTIYRIGIIADTHDVWHSCIPQILSGVDEIWHLGDLCRESIVDEMRAITNQVIVVLGNNDFTLHYPLERRVERFGETFFLTHIEPRRIPPSIHWLLHGHTHHPRQETISGIHFFNPGPAGRANKGSPLSIGVLTKKSDQSFQGEIIPIVT